jgi:hypothetical protein
VVPLFLGIVKENQIRHFAGMAAGCLTSRGMTDKLRGKRFRILHDAFLFFGIARIIHTGCPNKVVVFESQNLEKEMKKNRCGSRDAALIFCKMPDTRLA